LKVLILDNYDSFVYNLADYVGKLGAEPIVVRSNRVSIEEVEEVAPDRIILSPGPGHPSQRRFAGICPEVLDKFSRDIPTLGVCLGHQIIVLFFGGGIKKAKRILHGKSSLIKHDGKGIFKGLENPLEVGRYHSLTVSEVDLPSCLEVAARSLDDGEIMAVRHKDYPIAGVQFHPESILTRRGIEILRNFLEGEI